MPAASVLEVIAAAVPAGRGPAFQRPLFQNALLPPYRPWSRGLLASLVLHLMAVAFGPSLLALLPESDEQAMGRHLRAMRPLELRIPERLYLPPPPVEEKRTETVGPKTSTATPQPLELATENLRAGAAGSRLNLRSLPKEFTPPPQVARSTDPQTLLQAHLPPDLKLETPARLPEMAFFDGPVLPKPAPRQFVEPGRSAAPAVVPRIDTPPPLVGGVELDQGVRIPPMLAGPEQALLHLPRPTVPVRQFQAPAPVPTGRGASVSPAVGDPINILAISPDPAPIQDRVIIPPGNQVGQLPTLPHHPGTGQGQRQGSGSGAQDAERAKSPGEALLGELAKAIATLPARYQQPIRIEHPVNAVYDVVVQAAAEEALPESVGVLSGQPVYTVYLEVGAPKAWLLQYCVPGENLGATQKEGVVSLGAPPRIQPPYPMVTLLPPVTMIPRSSYIFVHGFIDESGRFARMNVLRAPRDELKQAVLDGLAGWQFRPAVREGRPVTVEVLLAIPPQRL